MKNFFGAISGILCALLGAAASVFGGWSAALTTLLVFMLVDYASGLIAATVPVYQNALQAMRRFRALTVMSLLGAPIRLVVLVALLPFRALSAYFSAQTATGIWSIGCCVFSLRREIVGVFGRLF